MCPNVFKILLVKNTALLYWVLYCGIKYESRDFVTNDRVLKKWSDDGGKILAQISSSVAW